MSSRRACHQRPWVVQLAGDLGVRWPGAETGQEVIARMTHALEYVAARHRGRSAIVVSHGGVMSLTLPRIARDSGVPMHAPPTLAHGAVLQIEAGEDTWRFTSRWGD